MLDRAMLRDNLPEVTQRLRQKGFEFDQASFQDLDRRERELRLESEKLRALRNRAGEQIAQAKKEGQNGSQEIREMRDVSAQIKQLDEDLGKLAAAIEEFMAVIPNLPDSSVPVGADETANRTERIVGTPREFDFEIKDHVTLGAELSILDPDRAAKITGSRFTNYYGTGARLERALINFMLDVHTQVNGYHEVLPPFMANRQSFFGTGNLPKFEADLFALKDTDYFLIPTAEVPVTNLFAGEILEETQLALAFTANTPCFRSEAGSYGKDTRGLIRQHQFNKVELVRFSRPEESFDQLELLTSHAESILQRLELPYRVVTLSTGDMSFSSAKTYDIEVWVPSQDKYREISSCSNFVDFQARRANIRYRPESSKRTRFVHTLNGSGLAIGRTWVAIIENFQQGDGSILIPQALRPYLGGVETILAEDPFRLA